MIGKAALRDHRNSISASKVPSMAAYPADNTCAVTAEHVLIPSDQFHVDGDILMGLRRFPLVPLH